MKELIIFTILGLSSLLTAIGGPINSDPAPGRSPGPPSSHNNNNEVFIEDKEEILHSIDVNILNSNTNAMLMKLSSEENVRSLAIPSSSISSLLLSSSKLAALTTQEGAGNIISDERINSSSSASAALTSSSSSLLLSKTSSSRQCLDNFLNGYDKIVKTKTNDGNLIHLYVEHDIFTMQKGLLPNFVYLGE